MKVKGSVRINSLPTYKPGKSTDELQRELGFKSAIKLASNENPLGPSTLVIEKIKEAASMIHVYPDGDCHALKKKISFKEEILPNQIVLGNGSNEVLELIAHTFLDKDDEAIMGEFCFIVYPIVTQLSEANIVRVPMKNLALSLNDVLSSITQLTKVIFIANPNNPTGTYLTKLELIVLRKKLRKNILLVVDDAYAEYMKNKDYSSGLDLFKNKDNVFILRTFSKMFGLASLRVGWGYGSKKIVDALNVIKPPFNVNGIAQLAAIESLKDKKFINKSVRHNLFYSRKIKKFLEKYNIYSNSVSANFLLLDFEKCRYSAKFLYEKLKNKGIILRSTEDGYHIKNKLRLTIGSKKENLKLISESRGILS